MSSKKIFLSIPIILAIVFFAFFLTRKNYSSFKIESRISDVSKVKIEEKNGFQSIGWIRVEGTNIDVPLLWSNNIYTDFPVELEGFSWSLNNDTKFHNHLVVMGHNIFNLSAKPKKSDKDFHRFEELMSFVYYDFAKENQYIQLTLDGKEYLYKIFSVGFLKDSYLYKIIYSDDYSKSQMKDYVQLMRKKSIYQYDNVVGEDDKVITLLTCTRLFGVDSDVDFFVTGRLLRDDEKKVISSIKKTDKYKEIEKKLKGDETNEESYM